MSTVLPASFGNVNDKHPWLTFCDLLTMENRVVTYIMRSVMSFVANKEQQKDTAYRRQRKTNILDTETLGDLTQQSIDREGNNQEEIEVDKGKGVAVGNACVSGELA